MNNTEKAFLYDEYIRESDVLQRSISRIKSEFAGNIPEVKVREIQLMEIRINELVELLNKLYV